MNAVLRRRLERAARVRDFIRAHKTDGAGEGTALARLEELLVFLRGGPGEQLWLREADREAVGLAPREVELALAGGQRLEVEPLDAGPDLGRSVALREHVAVAVLQAVNKFG